MKVVQYKALCAPFDFATNSAAHLVLVFASRKLLEESASHHALREKFPQAKIVCCSTAGEIFDTQVNDDSFSISAIEFERTEFQTDCINIADCESSFDAGTKLIAPLLREDLKHVLVLADGQMVNGSELVRGMNEALPAHVTVSGGLAGDGSSFEKTLVGLNDDVRGGNLLAISLYGTHICIGHGSKGGWDSFGPDRKITRSKDNVLFELDGKSALGLYKRYLGDLANSLPGSALLFPLALREEGKESVVRTILSINEEEQSMTFAGDMPEGAYARLMKANFDRLIDAASLAAGDSFQTIGGMQPQLALLISCVGRKLVLDQRVEEEVESVREMLGKETALAGFYSYGEISPFNKTFRCELHNQTMTITTFNEV